MIVIYKTPKMSENKKNYQQASKTSSFLPDAFYDIFTYITPSLFLVTGILLSLDNPSALTAIYRYNASSFLVDIAILIVAIGILYTIGTILTTLSYLMIHRIFKKRLIRKDKIEDTEYDIGDILIIVKSNAPLVALEYAKRWSRLNLTRNTSLVTFILSFVYLFRQKFFIASILLGFTIILLWMVYIRILWIYEDFETIQKEEL